MKITTITTAPRAGATCETEWSVYLPHRAMRVGMVQYRARDKRFKPRAFLPDGVVALPSCATRQGAIDSLVRKAGG